MTSLLVARSVDGRTDVNRSKLLSLVALTALAVCLGSWGIAVAQPRARPAGRSTAAVPTVGGKTLLGAYVELHRDGLKVAFTHAFSVDWSGECIPLVTSSKPAPGHSVPRDSTIILSTRIPPCGVASPARPNPSPGPYRVPSFSGKPLSVAIRWVKAHGLLWAAATIPALRDSDAASLYANYVITRQKPQPGAKLTVGVVAPGGGWEPTPLQLQVRPR